jgi:hypothetical protein
MAPPKKTALSTERLKVKSRAAPTTFQPLYGFVNLESTKHQRHPSSISQGFQVEPGISEILESQPHILEDDPPQTLGAFLSGGDALQKLALSVMITKELMQRYPMLRQPVLDIIAKSSV